MDFGLYPPEINSGRMYAGPGSGPMLAAAQAWDALTDEIYTAASAYQSVTSELADGSWSGPSSTSMAAAAATYVTWLSATAAQAEQTATQARAAAAGYEAAFASTVPPPVIAAKRALLMALVSTNFFGQNTAAIAATEAQYAEMWAQDAIAMYTYAGSSAAASVLTPFISPDQTTDPGGTSGQAAAVSQATGTSAGNAQSAVSAASQAVSGATTSAATDPLSTLSDLITIFFSAPADLATLTAIIPGDVLTGPIDFPVAYLSTLLGTRTDDTISGWEGVDDWPGTGITPPEEFPAIITDPGPLASTSSGMSASLGRADAIGALSVPSNWSVAAPEIRSVAKVSPIANVSAAAAPLEAGSPNMCNQMGLAGIAGQAMAGNPAPATQQNGTAVTHARLTNHVAGHGSASADDDAEATPAPRTVVTGVAAAIRLIAQQRDEGHLSEQEYTEQKQRLLDISARHRPTS